MTVATADDFGLARKMAALYRARGMNPLPMRLDEKRPMIRYSEFWNNPAPADLFERFETPSVQVMTGRRWKLLVIDLDGPEAGEWFYGLGNTVPRTWSTHSGGGGLHLWFRLPAWIPQELPKVFLWQGEGKHSGVERLCDGSLIVAPPSIHPKTGQRYRFSSKAESPARLPLPTLCPGWILRLPPVEKPKPLPVSPFVAPIRQAKPVTAEGHYRAKDVLDAIGDKIAVAEGWGLRVATRRANAAGWCQCHALGREDRSPSASISAESGRYWESGERSISLFELGVRLGVYLDWRDAANDLGARFNARRVA